MEVFKNIIAPLLSPILTVIGIFLIARNERIKINLNKKTKLKEASLSLYRDLNMMLAACEVLSHCLPGSKASTDGYSDEYLVQLKKISERFFKTLYSDPEIFTEYFPDPEMFNKQNSPKNNLYLLLSEFEIRANNYVHNQPKLLFIMFSIYSLLYVYEVSPTKKEKWDEGITMMISGARGEKDLFENLDLRKR